MIAFLESHCVRGACRKRAACPGAMQRAALDLKNVPAVEQVWLNVPSHYDRIWTST
jgi:hypothetical protein